MSRKKTLILIDGHALAFRQYYALERSNMRTSEDVPTWAVFGFFKAVFDLLKNKKLKADAIAVAFDVSHKTFRTEKFVDYKCNRSAMPDAMKIQMDLIYEGLRAFSIPVYTKEGFEADDVIGTISKRACEEGHKVLILTGDQDAFQLVDKAGCIKVILPSKGDLTEYNWDKIYEKLGVYPNQVIDYKALRGDVSDCIPGIKGIGEKTACKLLAKYKTLDACLADCDNIPEKGVREKICAGKADAELSRYLATIVRDLDIDFDINKTQVQLPDISKVTAFLTKLQFLGFIKNINEILGLFNKSETKEISENISQDVPEGQMHFGFSDVVKKEINKSGLEYTQKLINDSEDLENLVKNLKENSLIAFKIHYEYKSLLNPLITGIAFGFNKSIKADKQVFTVEGDDKSETFYIPIAHTTVPAQLLLSDVISALKPIFEDENIKKTTYNYKEEYNVLRAKNINLKGVIFDIMLASYVYDSTRNHDIEFQSLEHLNHAMAEYSPYEKDKSKQISFKDALIQDAQKYACDETAVIFELTKYWQKELSDKECNLLYNIEVPMSKVLADMEYSGVSIDKNYLKELSYSMEESLHEAEEKIYQIAGMRFNINSPRQVGDVLFNKLGLKPGKKRGNKKYSTNAAVLEELAEDYEIADLILQYRKYAKLKSTYTDALPELIDYTDGRIHTTYNQTVAVTGRLSSSNPNLQNIPIRSEEGNKIRKAFVPSDRENGVILSADYSQIELRMLAHITGDVHLTEAFNSGMDVHTAMAAKIFEVPVEEVTKEMRQKAKTVNFGIVYGQSKYGLAQTLGISKDEAGLFIDKYFATYPAVKDYMQGTVLLVEEKGYVETIFGRKRYLSSELRSPNAFIREAAKRAAINQPMQGSAADLLKIAMIDFSKKLEENNLKSKMIMQVHDELVVETNNSELEIVKKHIKESMELNQPLSVPLVIDISAGSAWED